MRRLVFPSMCLALALGLAFSIAGSAGSPAHAQTASDLVPDLVPDLVETGRRALEAGRHAEAIRSLEAAVKIEPGAAGIHSMLGRAYLLDHQAKPAQASLARSAELGSQDPRTFLYMGSAAWELGRPEDAEAAFRKALGSGSGASTLIALQQLGRLLLWQGRPAEALDPLQRAAVLLPDEVDLQLQLAQALDASDKPAEALAAWRRAVTLAPELARARYGLAQQLRRSGDLGDRETAGREMETFRRLTAADGERIRRGNLERARLDEGWALLQGGRAREAEALFAQLGESPEALSGVAFSRSAAGDHRGAVTALEKAVALAPDRDDLRRALDEERLAAEGEKP